MVTTETLTLRIFSPYLRRDSWSLKTATEVTENSSCQDSIKRSLFIHSLISLDAFLECKILDFMLPPIGLKQELEPRTHTVVKCFNHQKAGYSQLCISPLEGILKQ